MRLASRATVVAFTLGLGFAVPIISDPPVAAQEAAPSDASGQEAASTGDCSAPPELIRDDPTLPRLAARLLAKQPVTIVAIGGASTAGNAAGDAGKSYPARLQIVLTERYPGVPITVINKGIAHQTAQDMVDRFGTDVLPQKPDLVLWETGTTEAVRGVDVDQFTSTLQNGIDLLRESRIEVMLVDMQFARDTASVINYQPYLDAMHQVADVNDVYLFRRFDIMKYWSESGAFRFRDVPKAERAPLTAQYYDCLAQRLGDAIAYAAR
jgi:hypothetical protein